MTRVHIAVNSQVAELHGESSVAITASCQQLEKLFLVRSGVDYMSTDEEFWLFVFELSLWVVPDLTTGLKELLSEWGSSLESTPCFEVGCPDLPKPWRKRFLFLTLPSPRLGAFARSTLPQWTHERQVDYKDWPRLEVSGKCSDNG